MQYVAIIGCKLCRRRKPTTVVQVEFCSHATPVCLINIYMQITEKQHVSKYLQTNSINNNQYQVGRKFACGDVRVAGQPPFYTTRTLYAFHILENTYFCIAVLIIQMVVVAVAAAAAAKAKAAAVM